jgi:NADH:ubiquinone oxidoreductase subunit 2 (subunit N)
MIVLTSVISAGYYVRLVTIMFMKPRPADGGVVGTPAPRAGALTRWVIGVNVVLLLTLGLVPTYMIVWSERSVPTISTRTPLLVPSAGVSPDR